MEITLEKLQPAKSTFVVTGCAGFIGSHLTDTLLAQGHQVRGIDRFTDYYSRRVKERNLEPARQCAEFELIEDDLSTANLVQLFDGCSGVFHLAAQPGVRGSWGDTFRTYADDNIVATQRVFEAAVHTGTRVVWASSSSIYGDAATYPTRESDPPQPVSPYGITKLTCELLARTYRRGYGLDHVALRYFTVYGPRQRPDMAFSRIVNSLLQDTEFTVLGSGDQSRDFTYVGDAVAGTIAAMHRAPEGRAYNVGGGTEISLNAVIEIAEDLIGRSLLRSNAETASGDVRRTAADTSLAMAELDWRPTVSIREGLQNQMISAALADTSQTPALAG